jgi:Ribbon-helix-helix protein, copG family
MDRRTFVTRLGGTAILGPLPRGGVAAGDPVRLGYQVSVLHGWHECNTIPPMKTLTVRLPEALVAEIEAESRERQRSRSDVVRERLSGAKRRSRLGPPTVIADLVGSVGGLPADLSRQRKKYLRATGYGRKRAR